MKLDLTSEQVKEATNTEIIESIHNATSEALRFAVMKFVDDSIRKTMLQLTCDQHSETFRFCAQTTDISLRYEIKKCFTQPTPVKPVLERMPDQSR